MFARITPADKLHIVEELQASGEVVAVTGDGVNDAPALRRADVGIAMGRSGSEAAREASDVVLTNDELGTIVAAVREGRRIYANITKFVAFLLSANLGEVVLFAVAILAGLGAPMTVVQVLVINLLTDGLPAVALARDPALPGHERVARSRTGALLSGRLWAALAVVGVLIGLAAFAAFTIGKAVDGDTGRTMAFLTVGLAELGFVFSCRSVLTPAWRVPRNPYLAGSVAASLVLLLLAVYLPVHGAFGTVPLGAVELITALGLALLPVTAVEVAKAVFRRSQREATRSRTFTLREIRMNGGRLPGSRECPPTARLGRSCRADAWAAGRRDCRASPRRPRLRTAAGAGPTAAHRGRAGSAFGFPAGGSGEALMPTGCRQISLWAWQPWIACPASCPRSQSSRPRSTSTPPSWSLTVETRRRSISPCSTDWPRVPMAS